MDFDAHIVPNDRAATVTARLTAADIEVLVGEPWDTALKLSGGPHDGISLDVQLVVDGPRRIVVQRNGELLVMRRQHFLHWSRKRVHRLRQWARHAWQSLRGRLRYRLR